MLSSILFILYTNDCQSLQDNSYLVKYADDTVLLSLLSHSDQEYGSVLYNFISWCSNMKLDLNVSKIKEMIINFSRRTLALQTIVINGTHVEEVEQYKYLGTVFDNKLKFDQNSEVNIKKSHQRLFVLRKLNSFNVQRVVLKSFYNSFVESILSFSFICWFSSLSIKNKNRLQGVVSTCSKIMGVPLRSLTSYYEQQVMRMAHKILRDSTHPLHLDFEWMPLGRRLRAIKCSTNHYKFTFVPEAIRLCNTHR